MSSIPSPHLLLRPYITLRRRMLLPLWPYPLHNGRFQLLRVRAHDFADLLVVFEEVEGGHGADAEFLGYVGDFVDVKFVEADVEKVFREPGEMGLVISIKERETVWGVLAVTGEKRGPR